MDSLSTRIANLSLEQREYLALQLKKQMPITQSTENGHNKRLVAYIVPNREQTPTVDELRHGLKGYLPEHMAPTAFVLLDALLLMPNGKVDRQALPAPDPAQSELEEAFVSARTLVEEMLSGIWAEVLGVKQVGIYDNFLEWGGHSLLATQIIVRVRNAFEIELPADYIFKYPTVAALAEIIEKNRSGESSPDPDAIENSLKFSSIERIPRSGHPPLSFSQERVWFLNQLAPESIAYNAYLTIRFEGKLDAVVLEKVFTEIIRRHEILRTSFSSVGGQPIQTIHPPQGVTLPIVDLCTLSKSKQDVEVERLIFQECRQSFDVTQIPLVRWTLLRLGPERHVLIQVEHHFVHDGWSLALLLNEIKTLYETFSAGKPSQLPELPIQFADFAMWQRRWMESKMAKEQLTYWTRKLTGSPPLLELPTDRPRPATQSFQGSSQKLELSPTLCESLRRLSRQEGVTLFMTLLAVFKTLVYRYTAQEDILVGSGIANRQFRETEEMLGMVINNVVLRTDCSGNPTFIDLLNQVKTVTLETYAHQDLPFEKIVDALQPERNLSYNPLFQVMFSFHDSPMPDLTLPGLTGVIEYPRALRQK